jgi:hypothetical protein
MSTYDSLTDGQKQQISIWVDMLYRKLIRVVGPLDGVLFRPALDAFLASPTGQTSTISAPAANSVAGLIASLGSGEFIPVTQSGLAGAQPIPATAIIPDMSTINYLIGNYYTDGMRQYRTQVVGPENMQGA